MYGKLMHRIILIALLAFAYPAASFAGFAGVEVAVGFAPPPLPEYVQPPCPAPGYLWTPGYWAYSYSAGEYYWVPGTWVIAPAFGLLWTPGYWGLVGAEYFWHEGYWGPHVGFYGGINYGFGYFGAGFEGGYWRDRDFYYNRAVTNVSNVNVTNVYNRTVVNNRDYGSRPSFNGTNGVQAQSTHSEELAMHERHSALTPQQRSQIASAQTQRSSLASVNHGHPQIAATPRPGMLHGQGPAARQGVNLESAKTSGPSSHPLLTDRSNRFNPDRRAALNSASVNTRSQISARPQVRSSRPYESHYSPASGAQRGGFGPRTTGNGAADSRTPTAHRSPPISRPAVQPSRERPSYSPPSGRPAFAQAPHNAPAVHRPSEAQHGHR